LRLSDNADSGVCTGRDGAPAPRCAFSDISDRARARIGADLFDELGHELAGLALLLRGLPSGRSEAPEPCIDVAQGMLPLDLCQRDFKRALQAQILQFR
jgi:hypothetical protein